MDNNTVTELLKNYRSYKYAVNNCGRIDFEPGYTVQTVYNQRFKRNPDAWDKDRYNRIVTMIEGAVNDVLSDDQRTIINRKYLDRNTMTLKQIAAITGCDASTVSRWHTEAVRRLAIALEPLTEDEREITNIDHMFETGWTYKEPA